MYSPFFPIAAAEDGGEHRTRRSFSSCRYRGLTHPASPSPTFPLVPRLLLLLDLHGRFPSPLPGLFCCNFLPRVRTPPPADSLPPLLPDSLLLQAEIIIDVHTILSLLLLLCLQPAATDCSSCCKWRAVFLGRSTSEYSNWKVQFLKPLGRKMVPLQQQQWTAMGAQWVRTLMKNGCNGYELFIKNGCRTAEQWVEQRLSPTVQR